MLFSIDETTTVVHGTLFKQEKAILFTFGSTTLFTVGSTTLFTVGSTTLFTLVDNLQQVVRFYACSVFIRADRLIVMTVVATLPEAYLHLVNR